MVAGTVSAVALPDEGSAAFGPRLRSSPEQAIESSVSAIDRRAVRRTAVIIACRAQILRRRTSVTVWSAALHMISEARSRVGSMFSARFLPLISRQMVCAVDDRLLLVQIRVVAEVRAGIGEHRGTERQESLDVPALDVGLQRVDVDREVEVVAHELAGLGGHLEHVEALEDEDVRPPDGLFLAGNDVVDDVAVDRRPHLGLAALHLPQEPQQAAGVVALRESLAVHDAALLEHGVGVEEAVGRDEIDLGVVGPAGQQRLQDAGEGALADGDAPGHAEHVGHLRSQRPEEGGGHLVQVLRRAHVEVQQPGEGEVDLGHLVEADAIVDAAQVLQVALAQGERRRRPQRLPLLAGEREVPGVHAGRA